MNKLSRSTKNKIKSIPEKIYLHYSEPDIKVDGFEFYEAKKLDKIKSNSVSEIIIQDLLDFHSEKDNEFILKEIVSKLKVGGSLHIQSIDLRSLCNNLVYSQIDDNMFKILVFGAGKTNMHSMAQIKELITKILNIKVSKIKFINGLQYYIECIKI